MFSWTIARYELLAGDRDYCSDMYHFHVALLTIILTSWLQCDGARRVIIGMGLTLKRSHKQSTAKDVEIEQHL